MKPNGPENEIDTTRPDSSDPAEFALMLVVAAVMLFHALGGWLVGRNTGYQVEHFDRNLSWFLIVQAGGLSAMLMLSLRADGVIRITRALLAAVIFMIALRVAGQMLIDRRQLAFSEPFTFRLY